jgi:multidrug efflux pump subunit AcrA (membrane-fusion protein)
MVANLVEKDVKRVTVGTRAAVEVEAFPGETFNGRVSRIAPVFDPSTRTAEMEIEVPNPGFRLKPGMYARVQLTVSVRPDAITIPNNAVVMVSGTTGVFVAGDDAPGRGDSPTPMTGQARPAGGRAGEPAAFTARFLPVETGIRDGDRVEIVTGLRDGARVVTTGAGALKDGDRIVAAKPGTGEHRGAAQGGAQTGSGR